MVAERRRHKRRPFACAVSCLPTEGNGAGWWWDAQVTDISLGGARIRGDRWFEPKDILRLRLGGGAEAEPVVVIVRVARVHACPDGTWLVGCQFVPELSQDELAEILAKCNEIPEQVN